MNDIHVEMWRDSAWKPISDHPPTVAVSAEGAITITVEAGYVQPPWRVRQGDAVLFERGR